MTDFRRTTAWALLLSAVAGVAHAAPVMPEILLVLDTSQSMQYRVGADAEPTCGKIGRAHV